MQGSCAGWLCAVQADVEPRDAMCWRALSSAFALVFVHCRHGIPQWISMKWQVLIPRAHAAASARKRRHADDWVEVSNCRSDDDSLVVGSMEASAARRMPHVSRANQTRPCHHGRPGQHE